MAALDDTTPLGLSTTYDTTTKKTTVSWSYVEGAKIEYFELQVWDKIKRRWMPFDGHYGIVKKNQI